MIVITIISERYYNAPEVYRDCSVLATHTRTHAGALAHSHANTDNHSTHYAIEVHQYDIKCLAHAPRKRTKPFQFHFRTIVQSSCTGGFTAAAIEDVRYVHTTASGFLSTSGLPRFR